MEIGDEGEEHVLKDCFSFHLSFHFVVSHDITLESISLFSNDTKKHTGETLLKNGMLLQFEVVSNCHQAAITPHCPDSPNVFGVQDSTSKSNKTFEEGTMHIC